MKTFVANISNGSFYDMVYRNGAFRQGVQEFSPEQKKDLSNSTGYIPGTFLIILHIQTVIRRMPRGDFRGFETENRER